MPYKIIILIFTMVFAQDVCAMKISIESGYEQMMKPVHKVS